MLFVCFDIAATAKIQNVSAEGYKQSQSSRFKNIVFSAHVDWKIGANAPKIGLETHRSSSTYYIVQHLSRNFNQTRIQLMK